MEQSTFRMGLSYLETYSYINTFKIGNNTVNHFFDPANTYSTIGTACFIRGQEEEDASRSLYCFAFCHTGRQVRQIGRVQGLLVILLLKGFGFVNCNVKKVQVEGPCWFLPQNRSLRYLENSVELPFLVRHFPFLIFLPIHLSGIFFLLVRPLKSRVLNFSSYVFWKQGVQLLMFLILTLFKISSQHN